MSDYSLQMTEKQNLILLSALELFAESGFHATSTNKIAKEAGVSEGLIFRHFGHKEGLLQAILQYGQEKADALFNTIDETDSLQNQLRKLLSIPFQISEEDYAFWKLMYALKWQASTYDQSASEAFKARLIHLLSELNYKNPKVEADIILMIFDGAATSILLKGINNREEILQAILTKYNL